MNINTLCLAITNTADQRCVELLGRAEETASKFKKALSLFEKCHRVYSSSAHLSDTDIHELGDYNIIIILDTQNNNVCTHLLFPESKIEEFLHYYRSTFPAASITPKLHLMEDHIVPFVQKWRVGFGLMGEQGAESIHTVYNQLKRRYANIHNREDQLRQVTLEHHRQNCPVLQSYVSEQ